MNRNDWEKQVYASNLAPTARLIALIVGSFGNWTDDRTVWPSTKAIADMAGMHRDTAQKYMDAFVEQEWLRVVRVRPGNVREYELLPAVASASGILAKGARANNLPKPQATSCLSDKEQLPNGVGPVASALGTNLKEPTSKEPTRSNTTVPDGPVSISPSKVKEEEEVNYLILMSRGARQDLERLASLYSATSNQILEAARLLSTSNVTGTTHYEKCLNALGKTGVDVTEAW